LKGGRIGAKRPTIRVRGQKRDAIEYYTGQLQRTESAITTYRAQIDTRKAENYGFASMAAVPYAHVVARLLEGRKFKGTIVGLAPNPKDIVGFGFCFFLQNGWRADFWI
jgi:calcium permeable stress-gated cation channel